MELDHNNFIHILDLQIESKHLLKHDFYQAWSRGELSRECLQEYAKEYYQHVKAFLSYLSDLISRANDPVTREILTQNLKEEKDGCPNHPELWKNFVFALGVTETELSNHKPSFAMESLIANFHRICNEQLVSAGIAALYAYESQIPEICLSKIEGLKQHYHMNNPKDWEYFSVHLAADKEHAAQERALLRSHISETNQQSIFIAVNETLDVLWNFLSSMCERYHITPSCSD